MKTFTFAAWEGLVAPVLLFFLTVSPARAGSLVQDDFSSDSGHWGLQNPTWQGDFLVANGALNYVTIGVPASTAFARASHTQTLSYTEAWLVQVDLNVGSPAVADNWNFGLILQSADEPLYGLYFDLIQLTRERVILASVSSPESGAGPQRQRTTVSGTLSFQLIYDPITKVVTASCDEDGGANGYSFQPLFKAGLENEGTHWKMTKFSRFRIGVRGQSSARIVVAPGQLSFDNWLVDLNPSRRTHEVSLDGTKPFTRIQAAIDHANPLDTVLVHPGTYRENPDFRGKDITVTSLFSETRDGVMIPGTIIHGGAKGKPVVTFSSEELSARLIGFTITNGVAESAGGILIDNHSVATISHCDILGNRQAVSVQHAEVPSRFEYCTFGNNTGPVIAIQQAPLTIHGCSFVGNSSPNGAIVDWFVYGGLVEIRHSLFRGNNCSRVLALPTQVSAFPPSSDEAHVINCTFYSNNVTRACITSRSSCVVLNSVLLDEAPRQIDGVIVAADYNLIRGGVDAIQIATAGSLFYGPNNLSDSTIFTHFGTSGLVSRLDSPTIGAGVTVWSVPGHPIIDTRGNDLLGNPTPTPPGSAPDLGAVELPYAGPVSSLQSPLVVKAEYGEQLSVRLNASNSPLRFEYSNLPDLLTGNRTDGVISGVPTLLGTNLATVTIENQWGISTNLLQFIITKATPPVLWNPAVSVQWGTPLDPIIVYNALSPLPGVFTFDPPLGSVLGAGAHTLKATFTPFDPIHYDTIVLSREITVTKVSQQLDFNPPWRVVLGDPPLTLAASSSSGLPVQIEILYGPGVLNGSLLEITGGGTIGLRAAQPGNDQYQAATPVLRLVEVRLKPVIIQKPGGSVLKEPASETVRVGEFMLFTALPDKGFLFDGWTGELSSKNNPLWVVVTNNVRVEPLFTPLWTLALTTSSGGNVLLEPPLGDIQNGTRITATAVAEPGYVFYSWTGSMQDQINPLAFTLNTNIALSAVFKRLRTVTLEPAVGGNLSLIPASNRYLEGDQIQALAEADEGYRFERWDADLQGDSPLLALTLTNDLRIAAQFRKLQRVQLDHTGQGQVAALNGLYHDLGESVTVRAEAAPGWLFTGWAGTVNTINNPLTVAVSTNTVLTAVFKQLFSLNVVASAGGMVRVMPAQPEYPEGSAITLTAVPANHYSFIGWSGALAGTNISANFNITTNSLVEASFAPRHRIVVYPDQDFSRGFAFQLEGEEGVEYIIEVSSGLKGWAPLNSVTFRKGQPEYLDTQAPGLTYRFYRLRTTD